MRTVSPPVAGTGVVEYNPYGELPKISSSTCTQLYPHFFHPPLTSITTWNFTIRQPSYPPFRTPSSPPLLIKNATEILSAEHVILTFICMNDSVESALLSILLTFMPMAIGVYWKNTKSWWPTMERDSFSRRSIWGCSCFLVKNRRSGGQNLVSLRQEFLVSWSFRVMVIV